MSVRAKMKLSYTNKIDYGNTAGKQTVRFDCVYDPAIPEDQRFQKASPTGFLEMQIDNPMALNQLNPGLYYYVDFSPAVLPAAEVTEPKAE